MATRAEMLNAIKANPSEDMPRLLYADWLDEQDDRTDHDKATAEFIRLSCRMDGKKVSSVRQGNWLDGWPNGYHDGTKGHVSPATTGFSRLVPTFWAWTSEVCAEGFKTADERQEVSWPGYPRVDFERKGRMLTARWKRTPALIPELIHLEFWRGFVRKAEFRHWGEAELLIPKLLVDQPLIEPELRSLFSGNFAQDYYKRRCEAVCYGATLGPKAESLMATMPPPYGPDVKTDRGHDRGGIRFTWNADDDKAGGYARVVYRAKWAVRIALRKAHATPSPAPSGQSELAFDEALELSLSRAFLPQPPAR